MKTKLSRTVVLVDLPDFPLFWLLEIAIIFSHPPELRYHLFLNILLTIKTQYLSRNGSANKKFRVT